MSSKALLLMIEEGFPPEQIVLRESQRAGFADWHAETYGGFHGTGSGQSG
jgi:hypothetical protein